jgi:hypothetical protein
MRKSFMSEEREMWEGKPLARKEEDGKECEDRKWEEKQWARRGFPVFPFYWIFSLIIFSPFSYFPPK